MSQALDQAHGAVAERIWLVSEDARDDAAELLRTAGAHVTEAPANPESAEPPAVVIISSSWTGRALVESVRLMSSEEFDAVTMLICDRVGLLDVRALLRFGVSGIVLRKEMVRTLVPAVAAVLSGQMCVPAADAIRASPPVLSIREKQVVGLAATGLMNIEIADRLYLAESTVKSHLSSAFAKLGVGSRHEAVELLLNPVSGLGLGILSLDAELVVEGSTVGDPHLSARRDQAVIPGSPVRRGRRRGAVPRAD